jgi:dolichyl-phosphate-mannose--protein O-mannosyl transferase/Gpi18-like mannosyltransferase
MAFLNLRQDRVRLAPASNWATWGVIFLALAALGAAPAAGGSSGKLIGIVSGIVLFGLVLFQIYQLTIPLIEEGDSYLRWVLLILVMLFLVKTMALLQFSGFGTDVGSYEAWALQIASQGPSHTYQAGYFLDYPPGYLYALWMAGVISNAIGASGDTLRIIVESPALIADFFMCFVVFAYLRRTEHSNLALIAMLMVALNPALLFDTVVWGQSDSVLTLVMWLAVVATLAGEYEISWALAAVAVLIKPQGLMIVPVLGLWLLLEADYATWLRSAVVSLGTFIIGIAPFQIGHPWYWIIELYSSTAAYYHETSVNAFNFIALIGGLRQQDSGTILGVSFFTLGMSLLVPLYSFVGYVLWRARNAKSLFYASFIALFGFFLFAPRMHERYLYPSLVFVVPLALESYEMMGVFAVLTITCLFNLAYIKQTLESPKVFLDAHDGLAMFVSILNVAAFALSVRFGLAMLNREGAASENSLLQLVNRFRPPPAARTTTPVPAPPAEEIPPLPWIRLDTIVIGVLVLAAIATRFWHIGNPPEIVFDEVHFVGQARHYLHGETFLDPHPPLAKLLIALGIWIFGDHSWSWRLGNATLGTILVGVTYLLGRRMFKDRLAATLAASFVLFDGFFLVDSRIACIDIVYLTFAAISYLLLFRFMQTDGLLAKRRVLIFLGIALGLCLGSKLYIPIIACLMAAGFVAYNVWKMSPEQSVIDGAGYDVDPYREWRVLGAVTTLAMVTAIFYLSTFLVHYLLGWWGGISDLFDYYKQVVWYENSVASATHPYSSKWWSWPMMLRPVAYWQHFPKDGKVATVWGGGNPLIWWGALTGMTFNAIYTIERPTVTRVFMLSGYLAYTLMWVWIGRTLFLYHYMPAVYLGFLALAAVLAQCWYGADELWFEHLAILATITPALVLGLAKANWATYWIVLALVVLLVVWAVLLVRWPQYSGKFVTATFVVGAVILFVYFFPVWTAMPIDRDGYYHRMWLQGPGIRNWI